MKKIVCLFLAPALLFSCNGHPEHKRKTAETDTAAAGMQYLKTLSDETEKMGSITERLTSLPPLSLEAVKKLLPPSLNGYNRTSLKGNTTAGYAYARADYEKAPGVAVQLSVQDCAGENGSAAYTLRYWNGLNVTEESEDGYTRTVPLNGGKAIESFKKAGSETALTWFAAGRLLVVLQSKGLNATVLHGAAQLLDFKP